MKKLLIRSGFFIACAITLIALFFTLERVRGRAAWKAYVEDSRARGVKLTLGEYLQPPIADAENFASVPIFTQLFDEKRPAGERDTLGLPPGDRLPKLSSNSPNDPRRTDLEEWRRYFVEAKLLSENVGPAPEAILKALEHYAPEWQQLREAAARPRTRFPVAWEKGFSVLLPHLAVLRSAAKLNILRLEAHLAQRDRSAAYQDFQLGMRLASALEREPVLMNGLTRLAMLTQLQDAVWSGLAGGAWDDATLRQIEADLRAVNLLAEYHFAVNSERAMLNWFYDQVLNPGGKGLRQAVEPLGMHASIGRAYPTGWLYRNQLRSNQFADATLARVEQTTKVLKAGTYLEIKPGGWIDRYRHIFYYLITPAYSGVERKYVFAHTRLDQLRLACALERHRLARGTYPETLQALVPNFVADLPHDVIDGAPLRYQRTAEGGYQLYSIARNRKDDGGNGGTGDKTTDAPDWVWRGEEKQQVGPSGG